MSSAYTNVIEKYAWEAAAAAADPSQMLERRSDSSSSCATATTNKLLGNSYSGRGSSSSCHQDQQLSCLSEEVFLLLQSVVMAVQIRDASSLAELEDCLIQHISDEPQQRDLLRKLVKSVHQQN